MTLQERQLYNMLKEHETISLSDYKSVNGHSYKKCRTADGRPLCLVTRSVYYKMLTRGGLIVDEVINIGVLKAMYEAWMLKRKESKYV